MFEKQQAVYGSNQAGQNAWLCNDKLMCKAIGGNKALW